MIEFAGARNPAREDAPAPESERGYLARPPSGTANGRGVLVLHPWWGLNETVRQMCDALAGEGFVVLAPDLYRGAAPARTIEEAGRMSDEVDMPRAEQAMLGAVDWLAGETSGPVGVVGFSMGASFGHWLVRKRPEQIGALVSYYGTGEPGDGTAPVLGHFATGDPYEPTEHVEALEKELETSGRLGAFHRYEGVGHWFAEADRPEFDARAAGLAWERTVTFLRERLGP